MSEIFTMEADFGSGNLAYLVAIDKRSAYIEPEHMLAGLVRADDVLARELHLDESIIKDAIEPLMGDFTYNNEIRRSKKSEEILEDAKKIASKLPAGKKPTVGKFQRLLEVGTDEILLAMVRVKDKPGFENLNECLNAAGLNKDRVQT